VKLRLTKEVSLSALVHGLGLRMIGRRVTVTLEEELDRAKMIAMCEALLREIKELERREVVEAAERAANAGAEG